MKLSPRTLGAAVVLVAGLAACNTGGSIFKQPPASGTIVVSDPITGKALVTSAKSPALLTNLELQFGLIVTEANYGDAFTAEIIQHVSVPTAANGGAVYPFSFNIPCFTISRDPAPPAHSTEFVLAGSNANGEPYAFPDAGTTGLTAAEVSAGGNPCHSGEFETLAISDSAGHVVNFYYEQE